MNNVRYSYSSIQVNLPGDLGKQIIAWGKKHIPDDELFRDPKNPNFGRENEIHVTVLYGLHSDNSTESRRVVKNCKSFNVRLGPVDVFTTNDNFDVVMVKVLSPELHALNKKFCDQVKFTNKFPVYRPHITIAYVKKGEGSKYKGEKLFEGKSFKVDKVLFSSKKGFKETLRFDEQLTTFRSFFESFQLIQ